MAKVSGSYLVARALQNEGVDTIFYLMGGPGVSVGWGAASDVAVGAPVDGGSCVTCVVATAVGVGGTDAGNGVGSLVEHAATRRATPASRGGFV